MPTVFKPFVYQRDCLDALALARTEGRDKALVVMATGLGKTVVSAFDIKRLLKKAPGRVLYLCHDNRILKQARKTYEAVLGNGYTYGYFHGTEKHMHHVDVLFASFQTMENWREAFLSGEFRYIVVDEFHHAHAATFRPTIEYFTPEFMLGLTATPERSDGQDIASLLGIPVFDLGLFKALARGYLCDVDYRVMTDEIQNAAALDTPAGKLSIAELNRTIFIPKRDEEIARIISVKMAEVKNPRAMIFCASITHAENMARLMPHAVVIHSKLGQKARDERLEAFRTGAVDTILTVDMLNEGIDVPEANVIVFLRSTASRRIFLQQLGRGLRKALGKLKVLVLDFVANCERLEMIDQLRQGVEDEYKRSFGGGETNDAPDAEPRERQTFTLTLDGVEFDERLWKLFETVNKIRQDSAQHTYTKEMLAAQILAKAKNGTMPTSTEVNDDKSMASVSAFLYAFGKNWTGIADELGLKLKRRYNRSKAELKNQLLAKAVDGVMPTIKAVNADPEMASVSTYLQVFDKSWNDIANEIGLRPQKTHLTKAELKAQLLAKAIDGVMPSGDTVNADPEMASTTAFMKAFGKSWNDIAKELGLRPSQTITKEELRTQLLTKAVDGVMPSTAEVKADPAMASVNTFIKRFNTTWNGIAKELGLRARS